jgi:hypothetical protein
LILSFRFKSQQFEFLFFQLVAESDPTPLYELAKNFGLPSKVTQIFRLGTAQAKENFEEAENSGLIMVKELLPEIYSQFFISNSLNELNFIGLYHLQKGEIRREEVQKLAEMLNIPYPFFIVCLVALQRNDEQIARECIIRVIHELSGQHMLQVKTFSLYYSRNEMKDERN